MWISQKKLDDLLLSLEQLHQMHKDIVPCAECKHLLFKKHAKAVEVRYSSFGKTVPDYYCPDHAPAYDIEDAILGTPRYYRSDVRVTKDGKIAK